MPAGTGMLLYYGGCMLNRLLNKLNIVLLPRSFILLFTLLALGDHVLFASYSLSLGIYPQKEAESLHRQLTLHGYPAYLLYGENCEVRTGGYATMEEAEQALEKIKSEEKVAGKVVEEEEWDQSQFNWNNDEEEGKEVNQDTAQEYADPRAQKIVTLGLDLFGHPYKYGGTKIGKGIDCSFFVQTIFKGLGISLPRTSGEQFRMGSPVEKPELKVGDLLFFQKTYQIRRKKKSSRKAPRTITRINHVGIYIGNGEFIHATLNAKRVTISRLEDAYYVKRFAGARRVLKDEEQK